MKRIIALSFLLLAVSLACQAVQRVVTPPTPTMEANPAPIVCNDDSCLDACLSRLNQELASIPLNDVGGDYAGADANFKLIVYKVNGDQITDPYTSWVPSEYESYQQDTASHQRVWSYFTSIVPPEQRKWITDYVIFTDGTYDTLAWIDRVEFDDNSRWKLGVDVLDSSDPIRLTETLTHELGHLITMNSDQIIRKKDMGYAPYQNTATCPQYLSTAGCSTPESYINNFYQTFWVDTHEDWLETVYKANTNSPDEFREVVMQFYSNHPGAFVTEYAATNIFEDMAESFEWFILTPKPTGNEIPDQKILFYYQFPELVDLRQQMIQGMCSYAQ